MRICVDFETPKHRHPFLPWVIFATIIFLLFIVVWARASDFSEYTDEQIVNAIYKAEGGAKAQYAYGIRSIPYRTIADARRYCFNTVHNNRIRFTKQIKYADFIEFLGSRYCPVGCDNDRGTNKFWVRNVKFYLAKEK